jgi:hypothetical protein
LKHLFRWIQFVTQVDYARRIKAGYVFFKLACDPETNGSKKLKVLGLDSRTTG